MHVEETAEAAYDEDDGLEIESATKGQTIY